MKALEPKRLLAVFGISIAIACGGTSEGVDAPTEQPDADPSAPDGGAPDAPVLRSPIELHTFGPASIDMIGPDKSAALDWTVGDFEIHGTAVADGLTLTVNSIPVPVDGQNQWSFVPVLDEVACDDKRTDPDLLIIKATNSLGESVEQRISLQRDPCGPRVTWVPTLVYDENSWEKHLTDHPEYVPCLTLPAAPTTVTLDGATPVTVRKYASNFLPDRAGNDTYMNSALTSTGCELLGLTAVAAPQNPLQVRWSVSDNLRRDVVFRKYLKIPGAAEFQLMSEETLALDEHRQSGILSLALTKANVPTITRIGAGTYTFRVTATDDFGNVTQPPDYSVDVRLLIGPVYVYNLGNASDSAFPFFPGNGLAGGSLFGATMNEPGRFFHIGRTWVVNHTLEPVRMFFSSPVFTSTYSASWKATTYDAAPYESDSCSLGTVPEWSGTTSIGPPGVPRDFGLTLTYDTGSGATCHTWDCRSLTVNPRGTAGIVVGVDGLKELPGSDIATPDGRQLFAYNGRDPVTVGCETNYEYGEEDCIGNGQCPAGWTCAKPPGSLTKVCRRVASYDVTARQFIWALDTLSFRMEGSAQGSFTFGDPQDAFPWYGVGGVYNGSYDEDAL